MSEKIQAVAKVQIIVEMDASAWGEDCSIGQLYKQAAEEAKDRVRKSLNEMKCQHRLIGEPKVIGIITEKSPSV